MADISRISTGTGVSYTGPLTSTSTSAPAAAPAATPSAPSTGGISSDSVSTNSHDLDSIASGTMDNLDVIIPDTLDTNPPKIEEVEEVPDPIPKPDPYYEKTIEVAGSGMGSGKKFSLLPGELMAISEVLDGSGGGMGGSGGVTLEDMQKILKEKYGIETQIQGNALVSMDGSRTLISDTNGNGILDAGDLDLGSAMQQMTDYLKNMANGEQIKDFIMDLLEKSSKLSEERQQQADASAARASASNASAGGGTGTGGGSTFTPAPSTITTTPSVGGGGIGGVATGTGGGVVSAAPVTAAPVTAAPVAAAPVSTPAPAATPKVDPPAEKKKEQYTVVKGDTLIGIAKKLGVDYADLKAANPQFYVDGKDSSGRNRASDGHWIYPGDKVNIP